MIRVLFVCLGNICRSPLAEAVFRHKINQKNLSSTIEVDSAGTGNWHVGHPPHNGTQKILRQNQIPFDGIIARQVTETDLHDFQYIIAMDTSNVENLKKLSKDFPNSKVFRLLEFADQQNALDVPDPYFTGNFEEVYQMVNESCTKLLEYIINKHEL
ncbi:low molecular weight protein-tyrosine-phosphatase [Bacillus carboniphilus]|uniref:protein-tyrosine-phosphatase n=1 Tax=Bacillus carboniphilus TaxID=86663 RepID=A0ABN0WMI1_9BACI